MSEFCRYCQQRIFGGEGCWHTVDGFENCPARRGPNDPPAFHEPYKQREIP